MDDCSCKELVIKVHLNGMMKNYSCVYDISNVLVTQSMTLIITYVATGNLESFIVIIIQLKYWTWFEALGHL